jgi:hypothetical protein
MSIEIFFDDDKGYRNWLKNNPNGYAAVRVKNLPQGKLHRANKGCAVGRHRARSGVTDRFKACSTDRKRLVAWIEYVEGQTPALCATCKP